MRLPGGGQLARIANALGGQQGIGLGQGRDVCIIGKASAQIVVGRGRVIQHGAARKRSAVRIKIIVGVQRYPGGAQGGLHGGGHTRGVNIQAAFALAQQAECQRIGSAFNIQCAQVEKPCNTVQPAFGKNVGPGIGQKPPGGG